MKRLILSGCIVVLSINLVGCGGGVVEGMPANAAAAPGPPADRQKQMDEHRNGMKSQSKHARPRPAR
ncbi:hypothetical protein [Paludisphaera borealis]|uniref:Uncharacterized protein n=1 Tax=Paludisphaera borealis TaxID=1387353 RepID=A0A1U7CSE8_9BACT|nr:hypothetical protein [Paludisphaera borealis]APW61870.1 hypothetical protein BSF38_03400 [Paludisphaera borealis]MDR3623205.1 hypothetical protein [Paludisphaera borealis]